MLRPEQRASLLGVKLRTLASLHWPSSGAAQPRPFGAGAALIDPPRGWLLVDEDRPADGTDPAALGTDAASERRAPRGWLGGAVVFAVRQGITEPEVLLDRVSAHDARRAGLFAPSPVLWRIAGRELEPVPAAPFHPVAPPPIDVLAFAGIIEAAGADAVVEHGVLIAEVLGLEVGRVVVDPELGPALEVGVGRHDRLANQLVNGSVGTEDALRSAVDAVRARRHGDAGVHPANRLAPERWLRAVVCADPTLAGAVSLRPVEGTEPPRLKWPAPAIAVGTDETGGALVVACSVGADLDAAAYAADARARHAPDGALTLVVPDGDDLPALRLVADTLTRPATLRTVPADWRARPAVAHR